MPEPGATANLRYVITDGKGDVIVDSDTKPPANRLEDADSILLGADGAAS